MALFQNLAYHRELMFSGMIIPPTFWLLLTSSALRVIAEQSLAGWHSCQQILQLRSTSVMSNIKPLVKIPNTKSLFRIPSDRQCCITPLCTATVSHQREADWSPQLGLAEYMWLAHSCYAPQLAHSWILEGNVWHNPFVRIWHNQKHSNSHSYLVPVPLRGCMNANSSLLDDFTSIPNPVLLLLLLGSGSNLDLYEL